MCVIKFMDGETITIKGTEEHIAHAIAYYAEMGGIRVE